MRGYTLFNLPKQVVQVTDRNVLDQQVKQNILFQDWIFQGNSVCVPCQTSILSDTECH
jgi:hypothetical protein